MYHYQSLTLSPQVPLPNYEVTVNKSLNTGVVSLSRNFLPVSERESSSPHLQSRDCAQFWVTRTISDDVPVR